MEGEDDLQATANAEMRYIALELMKIAQKSGRSFEEVAREYLENAELLQKMIAGEEAHHSRGASKGKSNQK
jgi:hypothetical protein